MTTPTQTLPALPEPDFTSGDDHCYYAETVQALLAAQPAPAPDAVPVAWHVTWNDDGSADWVHLGATPPEDVLPECDVLPLVYAAPVAKVAEPMLNGLTEAETAQTASVAGLRDSHRGGSSYEASMLRNLLARIHGDGGHYVEQHGLDKALSDADDMVADWRATHPQHPAPQPLTGEMMAAILKLPMVNAPLFDGEESDGTPIRWRSRPYVSLTHLERLLSGISAAHVAPAADKPAPTTGEW